jgi:hypothetical protein
VPRAFLLAFSLALPACMHALGGGVTGGISTRGRPLVDVEGHLALAGRLGAHDGSIPKGFWSLGLSPSLGLAWNDDAPTFLGGFGPGVAFTRYVGPHAFGTMLVLGMRFGEADGQKIHPFFVRLRVGAELELGDPEEVRRELGFSGQPEYFFHHDVMGLWVGAELLPGGAGAESAPDLFFTLTTTFLRRQIDEATSATP